MTYADRKALATYLRTYGRQSIADALGGDFEGTEFGGNFRWPLDMRQQRASVTVNGFVLELWLLAGYKHQPGEYRNRHHRCMFKSPITDRWISIGRAGQHLLSNKEKA